MFYLPHFPSKFKFLPITWFTHTYWFYGYCYKGLRDLLFELFWFNHIRQHLTMVMIRSVKKTSHYDNFQGYYYAGLQTPNLCYCGNSFGRFGPSSACTVKCSPMLQYNCGGLFTNYVYSTGLCKYFNFLIWISLIAEIIFRLRKASLCSTKSHYSKTCKSRPT